MEKEVKEQKLAENNTDKKQEYGGDKVGQETEMKGRGYNLGNAMDRDKQGRDHMKKKKMK